MDGELERMKRDGDDARTTLLRAFSTLVLSRGYDKVSITHLAASAGVARSTFYEHFASKEQALALSMMHVLAPIADAIMPEARAAVLSRVLAHLWENRRLTDAIFSGSTRRIISRTLGELIEQRLRDADQGRGLIIPYQLAAIQIAEAQLGLLENWLRGRAFARVEHVAEAVLRTSKANAAALRREY